MKALKLVSFLFCGFLSLLSGRFLRLRVIGGLPSLEIDGNLVPAASMVPYLNALNLWGSNKNPQINYSAVTNSTTDAKTLSAANCTGGIVNSLVVFSGGSANTNTTDTATNIIGLFWPGAWVGATAQFLVCNLNTGTMTLAGGTGVTGSGTLTTPTLAFRWLILKVTNLADPSQPGSVTTNTTTTTAAVAVSGTTAGVIPVTASTGMIANASYLVWSDTSGNSHSSKVTAINSLNITIADPITAPIASGASIAVHNNAISMTSVCSTVTAIAAA